MSCRWIVLALSIWLFPLSLAAQPDDPLEPVNRAIFQFNRVADGLVLRPASRLYGIVVPDPLKDVVSNLLTTLRSPVVFANDLLQGERERAGITLGRTMINLTLGFFGAFDMASRLGFPPHDEDFGQTLAVHGVGSGPYLVLPLLGPSNPRDALGKVVDGFLLDPFAYYASTELRLARAGTEAVVTRHKVGRSLDELERSSVDFYAALRSVYRQKREAEIRNGRPALDSSYEQIFEEDFDGNAGE